MSKRLTEEEKAELREEICENYCRWPLAYRLDYEDSEEAFEAVRNERCSDCPLQRF